MNRNVPTRLESTWLESTKRAKLKTAKQHQPSQKSKSLTCCYLLPRFWVTPYLVPIGTVDLKKKKFPSTSYSFLFQIKAAAHMRGRLPRTSSHGGVPVWSPGFPVLSLAQRAPWRIVASPNSKVWAPKTKEFHGLSDVPRNFNRIQIEPRDNFCTRNSGNFVLVNIGNATWQSC